jgi:hypothetical protein
VFAHALCALVLLWIWWYKPQDVQEPTLITDQDGLDACAYLSTVTPSPMTWMGRFQLSRDHSLPAGLDSTWIPDFHCGRTRTDSSTFEVVTPMDVMTHHEKPSQADVTYDPTYCYLTFGPSRKPYLKVPDTYWRVEARRRLWRDGEMIRGLDHRCIRRLTRAYNMSDIRTEMRQGHLTVVDRSTNLGLGRLLASMDLGRVTLRELSPFSTFYKEYEAKRLGRAAAGLTLAGACYGGLHLTAWTCRFPSYAETILWRVASVTILATGPFGIAFILCHCLVATIMDPGPNRYGRRRSNTPHLEFLNRFEHVAKIALGTVFYIWSAYYILCRVFIVVECFIMLAHIPESTLGIPTWARYIPHIT